MKDTMPLCSFDSGVGTQLKHGWDTKYREETIDTGRVTNESNKRDGEGLAGHMGHLP